MRQEAQKLRQQCYPVGWQEAGIFRPDGKPPVERGRFRQGCIAPAGLGLDGFCGATTLIFSGRKMLLSGGRSRPLPRDADYTSSFASNEPEG